MHSNSYNWRSQSVMCYKNYTVVCEASFQPVFNCAEVTMPTKNDGSSSSSPRLFRFSNCTLLRHHQIIADDLWVRDGKILNPEKVFYDERIRADVVIDCCGLLIVPGFIDVQINGTKFCVIAASRRFKKLVLSLWTSCKYVIPLLLFGCYVLCCVVMLCASNDFCFHWYHDKPDC